MFNIFLKIISMAFQYLFIDAIDIPWYNNFLLLNVKAYCARINKNNDHSFTQIFACRDI